VLDGSGQLFVVESIAKPSGSQFFAGSKAARRQTAEWPANSPLRKGGGRPRQRVTGDLLLLFFQKQIPLNPPFSKGEVKPSFVSIQHPASSIQHPASSIQHPASSIQQLR
jgi:hypothetical protein